MTTLSTSQQVLAEDDNGYFTIQLIGWYSNQSGNTATVHLMLRIRYTHGDAYYYGSNKSWSLNLGSQSDSSGGDWTETAYANTNYDVSELTQNYNGGATVDGSASFYSYLGGNCGATLSDVRLPAFVVAPNTPTVTLSNNDPYQNQITWGTSSFGVPSSGTVYLYGGTSNNPTTQIASKTSLGNSTFTHTGLSPNTTYYYRARAKNSSTWGNYSSSISITTKRAVYVPYEDKAKLARKVEAPLNGLARKVLKLYDSDDDKARRIY